MEERVRELEQRLAAVERHARAQRRWILILALGVLTFGSTREALTREAATRLTAPLQVANREGRLVLSVDDGQGRPEVRLFNGEGKAVVQLLAHPEGGAVSTSSASPSLHRLSLSPSRPPNSPNGSPERGEIPDADARPRPRMAPAPRRAPFPGWTLPGGRSQRRRA